MILSDVPPNVRHALLAIEPSNCQPWLAALANVAPQSHPLGGTSMVYRRKLLEVAIRISQAVPVSEPIASGFPAKCRDGLLSKRSARPQIVNHSRWNREQSKEARLFASVDA